jgi:hypothetical protein
MDNTRIHTIDNPFLAPPGTYPPSTQYWDYFSSETTPGPAVFTVPWQPGTPLGLLIPVQWSVSDIFFRQEAPGTTNSTLTITRYTGTGAFVTTNNINDVPVIIPAGSFESTGRPYTLATIDNPLVNSGDKLSLILTPGAGSAEWSFVVTLVQTPGA